MIHVIAVITAKPGKRVEILQAFRANVPHVRAERGCIEYGAAVDAENALPVQKKWGADTFPVIEKWESMDALKAHAAAHSFAGLAVSASARQVDRSARLTQIKCRSSGD